MSRHMRKAFTSGSSVLSGWYTLRFIAVIYRHMLYGRSVFDPWLIVAWIAMAQAAFYLCAGAWLLLLQSICGRSATLNNLLSPDSIGFDAESNNPAVAYVLTVPVIAYCIYSIVQRAKKCLDHASTVYILHFFITWMYGGIPVAAAWWVVHGGSLVVVVVASEYLCVRQEMREIPTNDLDRRAADEFSDQTDEDLELAPLRA